MKANELRLNNLVMYNNKILPIHCIQGDSTIRLLHDGNSVGCYSIKEINPILLTEDILLQCGFEELKQSKGQYVIISESIYAIQLEIMFGFLKDGSMLVHLNDCEFELKHLHQLQNLYFALTNEELTIKL